MTVGQCADFGNPNALRSSLGTLFTVPLTATDSVSGMRWLKDHGYRLVAATPAGALEYSATDLTGKVALLLGSEAHGLSEPWLQAAEERVLIPMLGIADSLNLAQSATVLAYEALRQRRQKAAV